MDIGYEQAETCRTDNTLAGGGEMGRLMREQDWGASSGFILGNISHWPQSLRTAVSICLTSRFPIIIFWGPEHVQFYNDAYRPILGISKHPQALGQRAEECWPEIWDVIGPMLQGVLRTSEATWSENQLLLLDRNGYVEEAYFTFSYSPIRDESGEVGGVFCAVTETTDAVLGTRRLATLRALGANTSQSPSTDEVCKVALASLADNAADLPFVLLYLLDAAGATASLARHVGLVSEVFSRQATISLADPDAPWPFAQIAETGQPVELALVYAEDLTSYSEPVPTTAFVLPIVRAGESSPYGFLVAGINPRHRLDDEYRGFLSLVAGQVATAIASARVLQDARERAEALAELDRAKTAFFSNVSHEFRTPLTLLLGPLETLLADTQEPLTDAQRSQVEMVRRNGLRQLKLVNTLLDFSRIEAGRMEAVYEPADLARLTIDLCSAFHSAIEQAGLRLLVQVSPLPDDVYVDQDMWEKIVLNLLSNAFKFTLQGEIRVQLRAEGANILLSIADTGVGIDPQDLSHLFERFYRAHPTQARTYEGSGIGLALIQELVRIHHGTIDVTSQPGVGSTFTVTIPRGSAHLPADRLGHSSSLLSAVVEAEPYVEEALRWLPEPVQADEQRASSSIPTSKPPTIPLPNIPSPSSAVARILVVDDNADMRDHLKRLLSPIYTVRTVSDGATALTYAQSWSPDLILTDVMMPGLSGFDLLAALHADARTRFMPVIVLSARAGEEAVIEGLKAGAVDYLVKPFSAREVLARVQAQIKIAHLQRESINRTGTLEAIFEAIADPLFIVEPVNHVTGMNRAARELLGVSLDDQLPSEGLHTYKHLFELYDVEGRLLSYDEWPQAAVLRGEAIHGAAAIDVLMRTYDGRSLFLSVTGMPVYTDTGAVSAAILVCRDVTERRRVEEALRQSEERFRTAFASASVGMALTDVQGHFLQTNPTYCKITGYTEEELRGMDFISITHPEARVNTVASMRKLLAGTIPGFVMQKRYMRKDGSLIWVQNSVSVVHDSEGKPQNLITLIEDVTERREWAQRTQEALETLLAMAEMLVNVPDPASMDTSSQHNDVKQLVQCACDLIGCEGAIIVTVEPESLRLNLLVSVDSTPEFEQIGREQIASVRLSDYLSAGDIARLTMGEVLLLNMSQPSTPGTSMYGVEQVLSAPLRIGEQLLGVLSINYDSISHKFPLEEEKVLLRAIGKLITLMLERERLAREKTDALARELTLREVNRQTDDFIGIISHELKSPLTTIKGNVQLARRQMKKVLAQKAALPQETENSLTLISRFLERAEHHVLVQTRLINDLLDVSRIHANRLELHSGHYDLVSIVREVVEDQRQLAEARTINLTIEESTAPIKADMDRVGQVLNNYLSNALKYSDESKPVAVRLYRREKGVRVEVVDEGPGLSRVQQEHIWERFYRVPEVAVKSGSGIGLGLGLHICRTIIERQGGQVGVESIQGQGATFWFTLPLADRLSEKE